MKAHTKYSITALSVLVLLLFSVKLSAQGPITGGIIAGVGTGSVKISDIDSGAVDVIQGKNIMGYTLGVYGKAAFGPFYVRPELAYSFRSGDVKQNTSNSRFRMHKFEVPVLLGFRFLGPLAIEAGPVYNYLLSVTERYQESDVDLAKNGLGYRVGAGLQFDRVFFNLAYQGMTYKAGENSGKTTFKEPYKLTFNIGVRLGE
jgi:hypothetical protein